MGSFHRRRTVNALHTVIGIGFVGTLSGFGSAVRTEGLVADIFMAVAAASFIIICIAGLKTFNASPDLFYQFFREKVTSFRINCKITYLIGIFYYLWACFVKKKAHFGKNN